MVTNVFVLLLVPALVDSQQNWTLNNLWDTLRNKEEKCGESEYTFSCRCDSLCAQYGDCCQSSEYFRPEEQRLGANRITCSDIYGSGYGLYLISTCSPGWKHITTLDRCQNPDLTYRDPFYDAPVTSYRTNITYRNSYCASCNNDFDTDLDHVWSVEFKCDGPQLIMMSLNSSTVLERMTYNDTRRSWILNLTGIDTVVNRFPQIPFLLPYSADYDEPTAPDSDYDNNDDKLYTCSVLPVPPETITSTLRYCSMNIINTCANNWTDSTIRDKCEAYTAHVCFQEHTYRNYYCIMCNNVDSEQEDQCFSTYRSYAASGMPLTFSVLLDWHGIKENRKPCQNTETFDPLSKTCRNISTFEEVRSINLTEEFQACNKLAIKSEEYILDEDNTTVTVLAHNKTYQQNEFFIGNDSTLYVCMQEMQTNDDPILQYITVVGLTLSIVFLFLHLTIFVATPKLRNLSTTNLASLCVSLLMLYCTFITSWFLKPGTLPCLVVSVLIHYSLLTLFCWMLIIAFDIWRALRQATTRFRIMAGLQRCRFGLYSVWGWFLPAVIVAAALTAEFCSKNSSFSPGYGVRNCWFQNSDALLLYVVTPLAIVMASNVIFFCWSAFIIYSTTAETVNTSSTHTDFRLYARLASIMGLTWLTGLIAGYVNLKGVWYVFVVLNTLQGLFIFIAFTCTKKIWREIRMVTKYPWKSTQQPSFSEQSTMATRATTCSEAKC